MENSDMLDNLTFVAIVLFILSVITEKITQLIRYYPRQFQILSIFASLFFYIALFYSRYFPWDEGKTLPGLDFWILFAFNTATVLIFLLNLREAQTSKIFGESAKSISVLNFVRKGDSNNLQEARELKERDVTILSFLVGFIITYLFNANMLELFNNPEKKLNWEDSPFLEGTIQLNPEFFGFDVSMAIGFLITGFFLSFGSKFFHDLMDTLLQVKNLKRKLNEDATYQASTIEQFDEYISLTSSSIIDTAIAQNQPVFQNAGLTIPPVHGRMYKEGHLVDSIDIHLSGSSRGALPSFVTAKLSKGQEVKVPLNFVYEVEVAKALGSSLSVANRTSASYKGTLCCKLKDKQNQTRLLTCSHVFNSGSSKNSHGHLSVKVPAMINDEQVGSFVWAMFNDKFDIALIDPENFNFDYHIAPIKERSVTAADMLVTDVKVVRQNGSVSKGKVVNYKFTRPLPIEYADGETTLIDLIVLSKVTPTPDGISYESFTTKGDSGAAVLDDRDYLIGMVVAANNRFTYAIAIPDILKRLNANLI